jgi:hypothetical protein
MWLLLLGVVLLVASFGALVRFRGRNGADHRLLASNPWLGDMIPLGVLVGIVLGVTLVVRGLWPLP